VDLDTALDSAVKKHESEPREMQGRKLELQKLAQQQFRLSDEVLSSRSSKVLRNSSLPIYPFLIRCKRNACGNAWTGRGRCLIIWCQPCVAACIQRGSEVRTIVDISYPIIGNIREMLSIGEEVNHIDQLGMIFMVTEENIV
jgi:hypothetical protein